MTMVVVVVMITDDDAKAYVYNSELFNTEYSGKY
jgi:hypothetical protein